MAEHENEIQARRINSHWIWVFLVRCLALFVGFVPLVPNSLYYLGRRPDKIPLGPSEFIFIALGFVMLWGSKNFGTWANELGKNLIKKSK